MRRPPRPLTATQAAALVAACGDGRAGVRNRAAVAVLYRGGLRVGELVGAQLEDIERDGNAARLWITRPKGYQCGAAPRPVGLDPKTLGMLEDWTLRRGNAAGPLFTTRTGQEMQTSYFRQLIPRLAVRAGITRRVHPHALRHTFARQLYEETGHDLILTMMALGHVRSDTTQRYLRSIGATEVVAATARRQW